MRSIDLLSRINSPYDLVNLLSITRHQANRIFNRDCFLNETQRELLMIKLGIVDHYVDRVYLAEGEFQTNDIKSVKEWDEEKGVFEFETFSKGVVVVQDATGAKQLRLHDVWNAYDCHGVVI